MAAELASLYEASREFARAADFFLLAAQNATRVFANHEAITLARRGLQALLASPDSPARTRQELALLLTLGWPLINARGYAATEVEQTYTRARELCQQVSAAVEEYQALWGLAMCYLGGDRAQAAPPLHAAEYWRPKWKPQRKCYGGFVREALGASAFSLGAGLFRCWGVLRRETCGRGIDHLV